MDVIFDKFEDQVGHRDTGADAVMTTANLLAHVEPRRPPAVPAVASKSLPHRPTIQYTELCVMTVQICSNAFKSIKQKSSAALASARHARCLMLQRTDATLPKQSNK
jgi:hypothetical protein